ncbi:MAG: DUF4136 domain-containing protein [Enterobacterales bacterium]|nr:DUF4136 domain-containing protein [Enterobacterales bacterium]
MFNLIQKRFVYFIVLLALSGCRIAPTVILDYDTGFDFSQFKSYRWLENKDQDKVITLDERRNINAIESTLNRKGFTKAKQSDDADFLLSIQTVTDKKTNVDSFYRGWGYYSLGWPAYNTTTYIREYEIGTLVLDVIDASKKEVVWRGTIASRIGINKNLTPDQRASKALKYAEILLIRFPPK